MWTTSMWTKFHAGRGVQKFAQQREGIQILTVTYGGGGRMEEVNRAIQKND